MVDRPPQPADDDSAKAQQRRRLDWRLVGAGLLALGLLVVLLLACVLWIPRWLYPSLTETELQNVSDAAQVQELKGARLKLQNDARTTLLQGLGALLVLTGATIGASVTLQQVRATRDQIAKTAKASQDQLELSQQGQITDRYSKAVEMLGDSSNEVCLGGIYALGHIMVDSPRHEPGIVAVLSAFIRRKAKRKRDLKPPWPEEEAERDEVKPSFPIQAALNVLVQLRKSTTPPDLRDSDLRGARLRGAQLQEANLRRSLLWKAKLSDANLSDAILTDADLTDADLSNAIVTRADLKRARMIDGALRSEQLQTVWNRDRIDWVPKDSDREPRRPKSGSILITRWPYFRWLSGR